MIYKCKTEFYVDRIDEYRKIKTESLIRKNTTWIRKYTRNGEAYLQRATRTHYKSTIKEMIIPDWYLSLYFEGVEA